MSISLLTFNNSNISPADDGTLYRGLSKDGILSGCEITKTGTNTINISDGYILACGRVIRITSETHNATLTTSGTATYKLYIKINTAVPSAPIEIISGAKSSYTKEDINGSGTIYELELAQYSVSTTSVNSVTATISVIYAPADYVIDYGTTPGGWDYVKYASGEATLKGVSTVNVTGTASGVFGHTNTYSFVRAITLPALFNDTEKMIPMLTARVGSGYGIPAAITVVNATEIKTEFISNNSGTQVITYRIRIDGTWK